MAPRRSVDAPSERPQVLIVGAGPTGLVAAIELRRRGIECRLIERRSGPTDTSRAITIHARTMEILDDMGIAERFLHAGVHNEGYRFHFRGSDLEPRLDYTRLPTRFPFVCMFNQNETEKILRDHLERDLGLAIEWETELTDIAEEAGGALRATLRVGGAGGREESVSPEWTLACDGLHSPTREALGIKYEGMEYEGLVMQMMDCELRNFDGADTLLHYFISQDTFLMIGRLEGPNHRVLVSSQGDVDEIAKSDLITPIVSADLPEVELGEPVWKTTWEIWIRKAERYRQGRVFLCGEAGHIHSVAGGQGWNVSMQDAYNLVWKLALVIEGRAHESLLDSYEAEREPVSQQVIEGSSAIHEIIMSHGHGLEDRMALTQTEGWNDQAVARISGLSYNYRGIATLPPGCNTDAVPAIGDRVPDVEISPHLRLHHLLAHTRHTLLIVLDTVDPAPLDDARALCDDLLARYPATLRAELIAPRVPHPWPGILPIGDPDGRVASTLDTLPGGELILVRPDGYIGCRAALGAGASLAKHLESYLIAD